MGAVIVVLVVGPLLGLLALWRAADHAEAAAMEFDARFVAAPPAPLGSGTVAVLNARRLPDELAESMADRALAQRMDALAATLPAASCLVVAVDGRPVTALRPDEPLTPASLEKLATATAVLDHMRPDERLATRMVTNAEVVEGVVTGDVWLVGGGDPVLSTPEYAGQAERQPQLRTPFEDLSLALVEAGVTRIDGRIFGDDGRYDNQRSVATWPSHYIPSGVVGPLTALSLDDGFVAEGPETYVPAPDPAQAAAQRLSTDLTTLGVTVAGEPRSGPAPPDTTVLAEVLSPPVGEIVAQLLRDSDNNTGELLAKELGLRLAGIGTTDAGTQVVADALAQRHPEPLHYTAVDGSGLDRGNRQTCGIVHALVVASPEGSVIGDGLAVAGRTGTLTTRFVDTPLAGLLRAKTGTLNGVRGLAGYAPTAGGTITFAGILNGLPEGDDPGNALQDQLVAELSTYPERPPVERIGPPAPAPA